MKNLKRWLGFSAAIVILLASSSPAKAANYKLYIISNVISSDKFVAYDGSSYFVVQSGIGCYFYSANRLDSVYIESSIFGEPGFLGKIIHKGSFGTDSCSVISSDKVNLKKYYVEDVIDSKDNIIVMDSSGSRYLVEYGSGCLSMWRYEDKIIDIDVGGSFLDGISDRIYLFDSDDDCRVWDADSIGSSGAVSALPYYSVGSSSSVTSKNIQPIIECGENQSRDYSSNSCVCVTGFVMSNGVCITQNAQCMAALGQNSFYNSLTSQCACSPGYLLNNETGKCIVDQSVAYGRQDPAQPVAPTPAQPAELAAEEQPVAPAPPAKQYLTVKAKVNIRKGPSTKTAVVGKTATKTKYEITDLSAAGWVKIKFGSKEGYISKDYAVILK